MLLDMYFGAGMFIHSLNLIIVFLVVDTISLRTGKNHKEFALLDWCIIIQQAEPIVVSQILIISSSEAIALTQLEWPSSNLYVEPVAVFPSCIILS
jgi:hypothetical protein